MKTILPLNQLLRLACALALAGVAAAETPATTPDAAPDAPSVIKLSWTRGLMFLPVEIQSRKGNLMVDTGAAATSLCDRLAKELDLPLKEVDGAQGLGIAGDLGKIMVGETTITVPGQKAEAFPKLSGSHNFIPIPAVAGNPDDFGVIGMEELSAAGAVLDCLNGTIRLDPAGDFHAPDGFLEIPMTRRTMASASGKNRAFLWSLPVRINGTDGVMVVDTGAVATVLDEAFAKQAGIELAKSEAVAMGAGAGQQELTEGTAPEMILGGSVHLGNIPVIATDLTAIGTSTRQADGSKVPFAGILGMDQIHRIRALLDCKHGVLFSAREAAASTAATDTGLIEVALQTLVSHGDPQAIQLQDKAGKNQGRLELTPLEGSELVARARALGDQPETAKTGDVATAIQKLAEHGDEEAKKLLAEATAGGGKLDMPQDQAEQLVDRARSLGLLGDKAGTGKKYDPAAAIRDVGKAIQKLAESGDEEAMKFLADAKANGGKLELKPEQAKQLIERAREKGLLEKASDS